MVSCIVCRTTNQIDQNRKDLRRSLHRFPKRNPVQWAWRQNAGLSNYQLKSYHRLCSDHFTEDCFIIEKGKRKLRSGCVPTLFDEEKRKTCCYCKTHGIRQDTVRTLHRFPLNYRSRLQKWLSAIPLDNFFPTKHDRLCSDHFRSEELRKTSKDKFALKGFAIPSIFQPISSYEDAYNSDTTESETEKIDIYNSDTTESEKEKIDIYNSDTTESEKETGGSIKNTESNAHYEDNDSNDIREQREDIEFVSCPSHGSPNILFVKPVNVPLHQQSFTDTKIDEQRAQRFPTESVPNNRCYSHPYNSAAALSSMQHDHYYFTSPEGLRKQLKHTLDRANKLTLERNLQVRQITRLKDKVASLKGVVQDLRQQLSQKESSLENFDSDCELAQFLRRYANNLNRPDSMGVSRKKYPAAIRSFALTLNGLSKQAYRFVREQFSNALPDPITVRDWGRSYTLPDNTQELDNIEPSENASGNNNRDHFENVDQIGNSDHESTPDYLDCSEPPPETPNDNFDSNSVDDLFEFDPTESCDFSGAPKNFDELDEKKLFTRTLFC